ncbi:hypothetical protein D9756_010950 [Leucocoprinus leucothites]|uniref:Uncharacterized protein n=1 Tax=Leucocoprinus leucothites TaxID=201217 RepID=A0A8H5FRN5_9AGAR|nr:hypothetical protein D9756_010950 [Leucoagaricus leucothites]
MVATILSVVVTEQQTQHPPRPASTSGEDRGTVTSLFVISETHTCIGPSSPDIALLGLFVSRAFTSTPFIPGFSQNTTTKQQYQNNKLSSLTLKGASLRMVWDGYSERRDIKGRWR